jgi:hypothetical protein
MQRSISGRAWDVVAGFELAYATTAGDQIRVPLVDATPPIPCAHVELDSSGQYRSLGQ